MENIQEAWKTNVICIGTLLSWENKYLIFYFIFVIKKYSDCNLCLIWNFNTKNPYKGKEGKYYFVLGKQIKSSIIYFSFSWTNISILFQYLIWVLKSWKIVYLGLVDGGSQGFVTWITVNILTILYCCTIQWNLKKQTIQNLMLLLI